MKKMDDIEAAKLVKDAGVPVARHVLAGTEAEAVRAAKKIGYPLVLKISSPDIVHKTEAKAITLDVENVFQLRKEFSLLIKNAKKYKPRVHIQGVIVQEMISGPQQREVIIGGKRDPQFGPVIMFGLGGIFVEIMKDVSFGIVPIQRKDAKFMISNIKGFPVLKGTRGQKRANIKAIEDCLLKISRLLWNNKRIKEIDINPLFIDNKKCVAADVRIFV